MELFVISIIPIILVMIITIIFYDGYHNKMIELVVTLVAIVV